MSEVAHIMRKVVLMLNTIACEDRIRSLFHVYPNYLGTFHTENDFYNFVCVISTSGVLNGTNFFDLTQPGAGTLWVSASGTPRNGY